MEQSSIAGAGGGNPWVAWLLNNQSQALLIATFGGMLLLMMAEQIWPRQRVEDLPVSRWLTNWLLAGFNYFMVLWVTLLVGGAAWLQGLRPESGLLDAFHPVAAFLIMLFALEFLLYFVHRLFHGIPLLWRIHAVHHMDTEVDVTTSHRHHTFESLSTALLLLPLLIVTGVSAGLLVTVLFVRLAIALVSHSNLAVPEKLDRCLRPFVVTPDFHRVHHSSESRFTNSNFGTVLPCFDYLFRTASNVPVERQQQMAWGLEYLRQPGDSRLDRLLLLPFVWRRRSGA